jgi:hypothetical protein
MKIKNILIITFILIPVLSFGQLKRDSEKPNISNTLKTGAMQNSLMGFLDPSKFHMSHSFSVSYASMSGAGVVMNTYLNTINYKFSDQLSIRTKLGIMGSPYNTLPNQPYMNDLQFFGGAEVVYHPSESSSLMLRIESVPANYFYHQGLNRYNSYFYRPSLFDQ